MINVKYLDFKKLTRTRKVNGESTIAIDVLPTENNTGSFDLIVEEATLSVFDDDFIIKKLSETSIGKTYWKQSTAIHKFFVDLIGKQQYKIHNGSTTFNNYMNLVFEGTGYTFVVVDQFLARSFENLGNDNRLALLQKGLDRFKAEFELVGNEVRFKKQVGRDTDFQYRYGHNIKSISRNTDSSNLTTVIKGEWEDGMKLEYRSPNADIFGEIEAPLFTNENYTSRETRLQAMKDSLQDTPEVSVPIDFVDLRAAGYPYEIPNEGDRVWLIYEPMDDLLIETRIMEIEEVFNSKMEPIKTTVVLSNYIKKFAGTMFDNVKKQLDKIVDDDGIIKHSVLDEAVKIATESIQNARTELEFPDEGGIYARDKDNPNKLVVYNSAGLGISDDGGITFRTAITGDGIVADVITAGTLRGIDIIGTNIISFNTETNDTVTLADGEITTFSGGKQRFGIYGDGLTAYHWQTEDVIATFRASHIDNESFGAGIVGYGDYFSIGKHLSGGTSRSQLSFYWDEGYDRTNLYGGAGTRDSGYLRLQSTYEGGSAGSRVPHLVIDNRTVDGTAYSGARFYLGRDNRSPFSDDFRSGFEVWQYEGNSKGGLDQLFKIDANSSGKKYVNAWVDEFNIWADELWVDGDYRSPGSIDISGGITALAKSHYYDDIDMHGWDLRNVGDVRLNRIVTRSSDGARALDVYNSWVEMNDVRYTGVSIDRDSGDAGVLFHQNHVVLVGGKDNSLSFLRAGWDSTSGLIQSTTIRDRPYTASANVYVTNNGVLGNTSSSRRYKTLIEPMKVDHYKILDITPSDWFDKMGTEAFARYLSNKDTMDLKEEDVPWIRRIPGAVAEDFVDVGLDVYVTYNNDNEVQSLMYDRAWLSLVPITRDHENRLNEYDERFDTIDSRIDKLEQEINTLKGVA